MSSINTDDENEEIAYEAWKIRELKRIKRDKDEREMYDVMSLIIMCSLLQLCKYIYL